MLSLNPVDDTPTATTKKKKRPESPPQLTTTKPNSVLAINSLLHNNPKTCLLFSLLSLQILLLLLNIRSLPFARHVGTPDPSPDPCESGRVFVYDLPQSLNRAILGELEDRDRLSNSGFGPRSEPGLIPGDLAPSWFKTDQFATEVIYHNRMMGHRCRAVSPEKATAFYVPFYAGLGLERYLWNETSTEEDKDRRCREMVRWLGEQAYFRRSGGWDHFTTMGRISWDFRRAQNRDGVWGSSCIHLPGMRNVTRLLIERNPWDYFDVGVPYPTGLHPKTAEDLAAWQTFVLNRRRDSLFCFAGAARGKFRDDFRGLLFRHCAAAGSCRAVDCAAGSDRCSNGSTAVLSAFLGSEFCLQPRGDSFTRRSIFDCMVAGAIPVFFWKRTAYRQYEWFLPPDPGSYSVYIDRNSVKNGTASVKEVLESYSEDEKRKMREKVVEYIPRLVYSQPPEGLGTVEDAFDVALNGIFRRFKDHQDDGFKW